MTNLFVYLSYKLNVVFSITWWANFDHNIHKMLFYWQCLFLNLIKEKYFENSNLTSGGLTFCF